MQKDAVFGLEDDMKTCSAYGYCASVVSAYAVALLWKQKYPGYRG